MGLSVPRNLRIPTNLDERIGKIHQELQYTVPGATWTNAALMVMKRGLDALEGDFRMSQREEKNPGILDLEVRLVGSNKIWEPASIRYTAGEHKFMLESQEIRALTASEVSDARLIRALDPMKDQAHMKLLAWAQKEGFNFQSEPKYPA
jgi:hypothetical protein